MEVEPNVALLSSASDHRPASHPPVDGLDACHVFLDLLQRKARVSSSRRKRRNLLQSIRVLTAENGDGKKRRQETKRVKPKEASAARAVGRNGDDSRGDINALGAPESFAYSMLKYVVPGRDRRRRQVRHWRQAQAASKLSSSSPASTTAASMTVGGAKDSPSPTPAAAAALPGGRTPSRTPHRRSGQPPRIIPVFRIDPGEPLIDPRGFLYPTDAAAAAVRSYDNCYFEEKKKKASDDAACGKEVEEPRPSENGDVPSSAPIDKTQN